MKKLIAFLLCLSLICSACVFADETYNSLSVLNKLNIGSFKNGEAVSRGEFIGAVSDILNYSDRPLPTDGIFSDVTMAYEHSGAIYDAHARGLISGYQDGTFGAKSPILYEQAIKVLVSALGYDNVAASMGGYPAGYMTVASQKGILKGVSQKSGDTLSSDVAAKLIENAMNTNAFLQVLFGSGNAGFSETEGETLLKTYAKIEKISGQITDNGISALTGSSATKAGNVIINGRVFSQGDSGACDFLGYSVNAYVTCTGDSEEKVLYVEKTHAVRTIEIPANRILYSEPGFSAKNIIYEDVYGNILNAAVDGIADFIYNGKAYLDLTGADLNLDFGKLVLIDNNSDSIHDVVYVNAFESFAASGVSAESKTVYKKSGSALSLGKCKSIEIYRDGKAATLSDIKEWDVVNAALSLDKTAAVLKVSSNKISGTVESISKGDNTIFVNGKYYHVISDELFSRINLSSSYEFCLDTEQNIAAIKSENLSDKYVGIVIDSAVKEGVGSVAQVKIFSSLGNFDVLDLSSKVMIDGDDTLTASGQVSYILSNMKDKLVCCKFDNNGKVADISLPYSVSPGTHQTEESLREDYADAEKSVYCYGSSEKNFDGKIVPSSSTVVFLVPDDRSELDGYSIANRSYFQHSTLYNILAYSIGIENGFSEYIIRIPKGAEAYSSRHIPVLVSKVSKVLSDDGMAVEQVLGYNNSGEVKAVTKYENILSSQGVKPGDIIRYKTDANGKIIEVERLIDGENGKQLVKVGENFASSPRLMLYDVYYRYDNLLGCTTYDLSKTFNEATVKGTILKQTLPSWLKIYEVKRVNDNINITTSTYNAVRDYKSVGAERSKVFIYSYSGGENMAVIYN